MITIFDSSHDKVISSFVATGKATYSYALENFLPLINRLDTQRKLQDKKFYERLKQDLIDGCIMPPITLAFISQRKDDLSTPEEIQNFINSEIRNGYILDGLQRLNTLLAASKDDGFDNSRIIYLNVIIADSQDKLLYRMITLNNGQKPMTPRHQIEILTVGTFNLERLTNITVQTEKEKAENPIRGSFDLADITKSYLAFLTNSVNNENNKIIDEKMDEIIANRVLNSKISEQKNKFIDIIALIDKLCSLEKNKTWFKVNNNMIGFSVGTKSSYDKINSMSEAEFHAATELFEEAFKSINPSKVNLGKYRRMLSFDFIKNIDFYEDKDVDTVVESFMELTA